MDPVASATKILFIRRKPNKDGQGALPSGALQLKCFGPRISS